MAEMRALMFDKSDAWGREDCTSEQVTWSDVKHTFRTAWSRAKGLVVLEGWSETDDALFSVMTKNNRLQYRIEKQSIRLRLLGSWRVYCEPGDRNPLAKLHREGSFDILFKKADSSGNGYLDQAKLATILGWEGFTFAMNSVEEVLAATDGNGNGLMDYWEFVVLMTRHCKVEEATAIEPPFSYGLVISEVDEETLAFKGRSRQPGRYEVWDGRVEYLEGGRQQVVLTYYEVYPDGRRKHVQGRLKCNGKFQCTVEGGTKQKARREDSCTAALEAGEEDVIKYFAQELDVFENAKKRRQMAVKVGTHQIVAACMHACNVV